jgi:hypothetical protein
VDVEPLRLEIGKAGGDGLEALADGVEMIQSFLKMEIGEVVGDSSLRRKVENFSYCLRNAEVDPDRETAGAAC